LAIARSTPVTVSGLTNATAIAVGGSHTCALRADATVACWGSNANGQIGGTGTTANPTPITIVGL